MLSVLFAREAIRKARGESRVELDQRQRAARTYRNFLGQDSESGTNFDDMI